MKAEVHHIGYGLIEYEESMWPGKRELRIDGKKLPKMSRNVFMLESQTGALECRVKGSLATGITLYVDEDVIPVLKRCQWYEYILSVMIFALILVWGNSKNLCEFIPVVGGAVGGGISGGFAYVTLILMRAQKSVWGKISVWLSMLAATWIVCMITAMLILALFF